MSENYTSKGTGTWNDESYDIYLEAARANPRPNPPRGRDHLRQKIDTGSEYDRLVAAVTAGDFESLAVRVEAMRTGEQDAQNTSRDTPLGVIAAALRASGTSPWTIALYRDLDGRGTLTRYIEVFNWR